MPEVSENAAIFLGTSYQALVRARKGNKETSLCDCTIALICACFYLEETIKVIIKKMGKEVEMKSFLKKNNKHLGMFTRFEWFYNSFVTKDKIPNNPSPISDNLEINFPGFNKLHKFRIDVSHGDINRLANIADTSDLRQKAKDIVAQLIRIAKNQGYSIPRDITYKMAIDNFNKNYSDS